MLLLSDKLTSVPVMSLQTGGELARTSGVIIDPRTMSIPALRVTGPQLDSAHTVLHTEDIRESGSLGFIIDDSTKLMSLEGLVRLQEVIDFHFTITACDVFDQTGKKLGRVSDFSFDPTTFTIQQIYIKQRFLQSLTSTSHIISRSQIVTVTPTRIVVETPTVTESNRDQDAETSGFTNPFRTGSVAQPDQVDSSSSG